MGHQAFKCIFLHKQTYRLRRTRRLGDIGLDLAVWRLKPGQEPTAETRGEHITTTARLLGAPGRLGETGMSLRYSSKCSQCVQRSESASTLHVSGGDVRGEGWSVRLGIKGVKTPCTKMAPSASSPDLAYHSQKAASMCPYR